MLHGVQEVARWSAGLLLFENVCIKTMTLGDEGAGLGSLACGKGLFAEDRRAKDVQKSGSLITS